MTSNHWKHAQRIHFRSRRAVTSLLAGHYHSVFHGSGLVLADLRPYTYGDDVRQIDWKATARTSQPYIRQRVEDRELQVMILVDGSGSMFFGSTGEDKHTLIAEFAATLAWLVSLNQDRIGLLIFSDRIEALYTPLRSKAAILSLIHRVLTFQPTARQTSIELALQWARRCIPRHGLTFLLSDFLQPVETYAAALRVLSQRHTLIAVTVEDALERAIPEIGLIQVEDAETQTRTWVDSRSSSAQIEHQEARHNFLAARQQLFQSTGVRHIPIPQDRDYALALHRFFEEQR